MEGTDMDGSVESVSEGGKTAFGFTDLLKVYTPQRLNSLNVRGCLSGQLDITPKS